MAGGLRRWMGVMVGWVVVAVGQKGSVLRSSKGERAGDGQNSRSVVSSLAV